MKQILILQVIMVIYSLGALCMKLASQEFFVSREFFLYYGTGMLIMAFYAIVWQQVLKRVSLSVACSNKAILVLWGLVWGILFFGENITSGKIAGGCMVIVGVVLFSYTGKVELQRKE